MSILLDTHIWLWSLLEPEKLSRKMLRALQSGSELWLSPISVWELTMLVNKNRIGLSKPVTVWVEEALSRAPLREAPVTSEVTLEISRFSLPHRDPADYFIVSSARVFDLTLATADQRLISARACRILPN